MESQGIPTVTLNMFREVAENIKIPRVLNLRFPFGSPLGVPNNKEQQKDVIKEALNLLETADQPGVIKESGITYK
ncbi:hypothetical protein [Halobacillus amylolyticus]|uniref:Uncharacterized protein n=1 Tax=Halobacillus amylolyticus TaxID=2932259 RepID=A0ABY4H8Q8_9BACI|nr:hypothetical protein [Halobacillus amylolyticus]UOR10828.1 hypothetical protein MUO15_14500 [Halobacillus amylolyticus]